MQASRFCVYKHACLWCTLDANTLFSFSELLTACLLQEIC